MRRLNDWVTGYLKFTENTESPVSYHVWTAISVISGALQRKCLFRWGHSVIYPNQYIVLIGPSGQSRKGEAMRLGKPFLEHIGIPLVSQRIIHEALIRAVKDSLSNYTDGEVG